MVSEVWLKGSCETETGIQHKAFSRGMPGYVPQASTRLVNKRPTLNYNEA